MTTTNEIEVTPEPMAARVRPEMWIALSWHPDEDWYLSDLFLYRASVLAWFCDKDQDRSLIHILASNAPAAAIMKWVDAMQAGLRGDAEPYSDTMSIDSPAGTKVIFRGKGGQDNEPEQAIRAGLNFGQTYEVVCVHVYSWVSYVALKGVSGSWNTCMFSPAENVPPADESADLRKRLADAEKRILELEAYKADSGDRFAAVVTQRDDAEKRLAGLVEAASKPLPAEGESISLNAMPELLKNLRVILTSAVAGGKGAGQ